MSTREVIAYAITHAPPGVKGGPYEAESGPPGEECDSLRDACRWPTTETDARECATMYLEDHLSWCGDARVIRIVRARPSQQPGEASAVEVLREYIRWVENVMGGRSIHLIQHDMRAVLAGAGPDPMPVVRAAMRETEAEEAFDRVAMRGRVMNAKADAIGVARANRVEAVDAYRKAGGTP